LKNVVIGDTLPGLGFLNLIDESKEDYLKWDGRLNEVYKTVVTVINTKKQFNLSFSKMKL
jgi:hypothetical protein